MGPTSLAGLYGAALFASAFLLFSVQPMFTKMALPLLGGAPAVWTTAQVFFQSVLFLGYLYAHLLATRLPVAAQAGVHAALVLGTFVVLPIAIDPAETPPALGSPIGWLIGLLLVALGAPFFVVSSTAPLLQRWFALTPHPAARDPYFLYSASNLGGLIALLAYPFAIAPALGLREQSLGWTIGFGLVAVAMIGAGTHLVAGPSAGARMPRGGTPVTPVPAWPVRLRWLALAFVPSSLLLAVTLHISTDVAASPVLWVGPLALFLLTFVLVFAPRPPIDHRVMVALQPALLIALVVLFDTRAIGLELTLHLAAFFVTVMVCHGELARSRPPAEHLTTFFLWMSLGGVLGGLFAGVIAPQLFSAVLEYPLALVLACLLRPTEPAPRPVRLAMLALATAAGAVHWFAVTRLGGGATPVLHALALLAAALGLLGVRRHPLALALGILFLFAPGEIASRHYLAQQRSFFGVHRVLSDGSGAYQVLTHGTTIHGAEHRHPARWTEPLTYFHRRGPLGQLISAGRPFSEVAIVGLGAGSMACYFRDPRTRVTFFEIDATVVRIATDPRLFRFLGECAENTEIVLEDGRRGLARTEQRFDLIVIDAFSSDAIPVHLLTREALQVYLSRLSEGGALVLHISNHQLDLEPVLKRLVDAVGLPARVQHYEPEPGAEPFHWASSWVVTARRPEVVARLAQAPGWRPLAGAPGRPWSDDYSNVMSAIDWSAALPGTLLGR